MRLSNANKFFLLLFITLFAFALRLYRLDYQSFWSDEGISLQRARQSVPEIIATLPADHVPLYFIGLHYWIPLTGESDFALRFFSLITSVLVIPFIYRLGKNLFNALTGIIAALIAAINPFQIYYAQETRMYAPGIVLTLAAVWYFARALKRNRLRDWIGYVLFTVLSLYIHYYTALVPLALGLFYLSKYLITFATQPFPRPTLSSITRSLLSIFRSPFVYAQIAIVALYLPWTPFIVMRLLRHTGWRAAVNPFKIPFQCFIAYSAGYAIPPEARYWVVFGFGILLAGGIYVIIRRLSLEDLNPLLAIFYLFVPLGAVVVIFLFRKPDFHPRYLSVVAPAYYLILAHGIAALLHTAQRAPRANLRALILPVIQLLIISSYLISVAAATLVLYYSDERYAKPDFRGVARHIVAHARPGDGILADGPDPEKVFLRYYDGTLPTYDSRWIEQRNADDVNAYLSDLTGKHTRLWVILYFHEPAAFEHWLSQNAYIAYHDWFNGIRLYLYSTPQKTAPATELNVGAQRTAPAGAVELTQAIYSPAPAPSGEVVNLALYWRVAQPIAHDYKVSARLTDAAGNIYRHHDRRPLDGFYDTSKWQVGEIITDHYGLLLPTGTPPGEYWAEIKMYNPTDWSTALETRLGPIEVSLSRWDPPSPPDIQYPRRVSYADWIILYGYDLPGMTARAGDTLPVTLLWQVPTGEIHRQGEQYHYLLHLWLQDNAGQRVAEKDVETSGLVGKLMRGYFNLSIDATARSDKYHLWLDVVNMETRVVLPAAPLKLTTLNVVGREHVFKPPKIDIPMTAQLGDSVELLGYAVRGVNEYAKDTFAPNDTIKLILYWKCRAPLAMRYKVFTHLLDEQGRIQGQHDSEPGNGEFPTNSWVKDEILTDVHEIEVNPAAPLGEYRLVVGMYSEATGERVSAFDATGTRWPDDGIVLGKILVE